MNKKSAVEITNLEKVISDLKLVIRIRKWVSKKIAELSEEISQKQGCLTLLKKRYT